MANTGSFPNLDLSHTKFPKQQVKPILIEIQKKLKVKPKHFCFISGPPRSGTTALNLWLHRHRKISTFGESRMPIAIHKFLEEISRFEKLEKDRQQLAAMARKLTYEYYREHRVLLGRKLVIEKEPLEPIALPDKQYQKFLQNIRILHPEGKFIFMVRDPIATIFSMKQRKWGLSLSNFEPQTFTLEEHIENWRSGIDCVLQYADDPHTYICQFGRLLKNSESESQKILDFLEVGKGRPFQPSQTKTIGFSESERELILTRTRPQLEALQAHGFTDLGLE